MGQKELKLISESQQFPTKTSLNISRNFFDFLYIIGRGGFGKVWKVRLKSTKTIYALKEMSKVKIIDRHSIESINNELKILSKLTNPFIINMHFAFQDFSNLYLVMDYLTGGDLRYQISKKDYFTESQTKFFLTNIILGLEYIHSNNIIHRDIKPENLIFDKKGYIHITDFGVAKINEKDNSSETSGTPGYMAPEVLFIQNHTFTSDFFALGVIAYELCLGRRPYLGRSRQEIKEVILHKQAKITFNDINKNDKKYYNWNWSLNSIEFINGLLMRKPKERIGYNGIRELKEHKWMKNVKWDDILNKKMKSPFIPKGEENFDKSYCESYDKIGEETIERYREYVENKLFTKVFQGYFYCRYDIENYYKINFKRKSIGKNSDNLNENNKIKIRKNYLEEKTCRNTHSMSNLNLNKIKEKEQNKTTRNKVFDNIRLNNNEKSFSPISLNKSNSVQIISFNSNIAKKVKENKKYKKQYKSISSDISNIQIMENKNKIQINKSETIDLKKSKRLINIEKKIFSHLEEKNISKKIQKIPISEKSHTNLKKPVNKSDIQELFDNESFQMFDNFNIKVNQHSMSNRINNKKNGTISLYIQKKENQNVEKELANSQRFGNENEPVFKSKIMTWINNSNIINKSNSKDKFYKNFQGDNSENEKNISKEKQKLNKKNCLSFNNKDSFKNTVNNNIKVEKKNNSLIKNNICFSPILKNQKNKNSKLDVN